MNGAGELRRRPPSGEQYAIAHGTSQVCVSQVGATLRSYTVGGLDVIDGFAPDERAIDGRGQVLAPWPNRLTDGSYQFGGRDCQAPLNEPSRHDAIHGLVRWLDWSVVSRNATTITLECALRPQPGYEWHLDLHVTYSLGDAGLTVTLQATNADTEAVPFGAGFHPYLTLRTDSIDPLHLTVPATTFLDPILTAEPVMTPVDGTPKDFRTPRRVGSTLLDTCFGDLVRGTDGRAAARLDDPDSGRSAELWVDAGYRYLMVYTADHVGPERHRKGLAIEPMTCPPDAFRTGTDRVELGPGETWNGSWGLCVLSRSRSEHNAW